MATAATSPDTHNRTVPANHLPYLDGIRGIAAFYVFLSHLIGEDVNGFSRPLFLALAWIRSGRIAVAIFIVLSGYCLMLPSARSAQGQLRGGMSDYLRRRATRILPPYYTALFLTVGMFVLSSTTRAYLKLPGNLARLSQDIGAHLFLVHNLNRSWLASFDGPMWSVATEWQIYFVFPLLLLPVWRRFGIGALIAIGFALGLLPHFLLPSDRNFDWAAPWYIGLFALGMAGAVITARDPVWARKVPWAAVACGLGIPIFLVLNYTQLYFDSRLLYLFPLNDALVGVATVALIVACARARQADRVPHAIRILESRAALWLGTVSYSLYLVHVPVLMVLSTLAGKLHLHGTVAMVAVWLIGIPVVIGVTYLFHLAAERPFMTRRHNNPSRRTAEQT